MAHAVVTADGSDGSPADSLSDEEISEEDDGPADNLESGTLL